MIDDENVTVDYEVVTDEIEISKMDPSDMNGSTHRRSRRNTSELRSPRQKFCARWQIEFPWLKANRVDESIGYCTVCRKELVCKKSHLERHQKSYKHLRMQGSENALQVQIPEAEIVEAQTCDYIESDHDYSEKDTLKDDDEDYVNDKIDDFDTARPEAETLAKSAYRDQFHRTAVSEPENSMPNHSFVFAQQRQPGPVNEEKRQRQVEKQLLEQGIDLNEYVHKAIQRLLPSTPAKDSFDLFFESVCATVKSLPPKLAAEVKRQVSQLIANFELQAICEKEAQDKAATESTANSTDSLVTLKSGEHERGQSITQYVYSFQQK